MTLGEGNVHNRTVRRHNQTYHFQAPQRMQTSFDMHTNGVSMSITRPLAEMKAHLSPAKKLLTNRKIYQPIHSSQENAAPNVCPKAIRFLLFYAGF